MEGWIRGNMDNNLIVTKQDCLRKEVANLLTKIVTKSVHTMLA